MKQKSFNALFEEARKRDTYWTEAAILEFTAELSELMARSGKSRADLARELGTTPAYITKVFRGDVNFTIETMVRLSRALGGRLHIHIAEENAAVRWIERHPGGKKAGEPWIRPDFKRVVPTNEVSRNDAPPLAA